MDPHVGAGHEPALPPGPPVEAVDRDRARRPGVPKEREPRPWPNARPTIERMTATPAVPKHGRPHKPMPPVYGTAVPLRGLSGVVRRAAYRRPDHAASHWLLLLIGDRVDAWGHGSGKLLWLAAPALAAFLVARRWARA